MMVCLVENVHFLIMDKLLIPLIIYYAFTSLRGKGIQSKAEIKRTEYSIYIVHLLKALNLKLV